MDVVSTTARTEHRDGAGGTNLPPFITITVLVAGVVGGLILVMSVILFCKYCIKRKRVLRRQPVLLSRQSQERTTHHHHHHRPRAHRRQYESLDSGVNGELGNGKPCVEQLPPKPPPLVGTSASAPQTQHDGEREADNDEDDEIDYAFARYKESLQSHEDAPKKGRERSDRNHPLPRGGAAVGAATSLVAASPSTAEARRVSFQLSDKAASFTSSTPLAKERERDRGRHGKDESHRKGRSSSGPKIVKQRSLGGLSLEQYGLSLADSSSLAQDDGVTETTPMLSPVLEESAPLARPTHRTQVTVEVHRDPTTNAKDSCKVDLTMSRTPSPVGPAKVTLVPPVVACSPSRATERRRSSDVRHARSFDAPSASRERRNLADKRKAKSYEGATYDSDYDRLEITEFIRGPCHSADYDVATEGELLSKVRYNDTGSFEEVDSDQMELINEITEPSLVNARRTTPQRQPQNYRDIWNLRATFEEEEDFSDTVRMEDMTSPEDQSAEEREQQTTSVTTSFESNTEAIAEAGSPSSGRSDHPSSDETVILRKAATNLLFPNHENRRQTYRSILTKRLKRADAPPSAENSFDSVETMETDGEVSESSRQEATTSFESTTDNTDSTGDSAMHKLQQMRGDSGYKSLETQQSRELQPPRRLRKQIQFILDNETIERENPSQSPRRCSVDEARSRSFDNATLTEHVASRRSSRSGKSIFERRNGKTASRKRREYRSERQLVHVNDSVNEPETDSRSDQPSGDSFEESRGGEASSTSGIIQRRFSIFARFLRSHSKDAKKEGVRRDYSVDEKTDALFHEFLRHDASLDAEARETTGNAKAEEESPSTSASAATVTVPATPTATTATVAAAATAAVSERAVTRSPPRIHPRHRLQRKQTEPVIDILSRRRERLRPSMRSASLGSDSSAGSLRRLSPQDSIEEEHEMENVESWNGGSGRKAGHRKSSGLALAIPARNSELRSGGGAGVQLGMAQPISERRGSTISTTANNSADIPVIRLPEEETSSA